MAYLTRTLIAVTITTAVIFTPNSAPTWGYRQANVDNAANAHAAEAAPQAIPAALAVAVELPAAMSAADRLLFDAALDAFASVGIDVSDVIVRFHDDEAGCGGYRGLQSVGADGVYTVDVCVTHERETLHAAWRTKTLLHELAHAHIESTITDAERLALMELRDLDNWNTGDWETRGAEHAAEILVWAITDGAQMIDFRLDATHNVDAAAGLLLGLSA